MIVTSNGIQSGKIDLIYGKFGSSFQEDMPTYSLPFEIEDAPMGTQTFAVILDDKDAIPVAGFDWIHWLVVNLTQPFLPENASVLQADTLIQGQNSWGKSCYGGMAPPDRPHVYDLTVFALDTVLPLTNGFTEEELRQAMQNHILGQATVQGLYPNQ